MRCSSGAQFFYAEYLLGLWHEINGRSDASREYSGLALQHAPVVLVMCYEFSDGRPLAGVSIQNLAVECNRVHNGSLDPSLILEFYDSTTDKDGCVRLPVYDTVYRLSSASFPNGFMAEYPKMGWFQGAGKLAYFPQSRSVQCRSRPLRLDGFEPTRSPTRLSTRRSERCVCKQLRGTRSDTPLISLVHEPDNTLLRN